MKNFLSLFLFLFLFSVVPASFAATDVQVDAFLKAMNAEAKTGKYTGEINLDAVDVEMSMNVRLDYDAEKKESLGKISGDLGACIIDCFEIEAKADFYANETEGAVKVLEVNAIGSEDFSTEFLQEMAIEKGVWTPFPVVDFLKEMNLNTQNSQMTKEDVASLKVVERKNYTKYSFVTEKEEGIMKGKLMMYTNGKTRFHMKMIPTVEMVEQGSFDFRSFKIKSSFAPKSVSLKKPY